LQQSLDGLPIESPEWLAHLRYCARCRALASAGQCLQDGLHLLTAPLPPPDLAKRIVERVQRDRRHAQRRRRWVIGFALAASLVLVLSGIIRERTLPISPTTTANRQRTLLPDDLPARKEQTTPPLREPVAEFRTVFVELSNETAEAGEGLSEGLQPVMTSARRAVDLFLRELPMETETN